MKLYRVRLTAEERAQLGELLSKGKAASRTLTHARMLLKADEGLDGPRLTDEEIAEALDVNRSTVERVRVRCVEEGFEKCSPGKACLAPKTAITSFRELRMPKHRSVHTRLASHTTKYPSTLCIWPRGKRLRGWVLSATLAP